MARLPTPGGDAGNWGTILNEYLLQALKPDGTIKDNAVTANNIAPNSITNAQIATDAVNASSIADGSITNQLLDDGTIQEAKLSTAVQSKLNAGTSTPDWNAIANKPSVIGAGATQAAARAAIGAGTASTKSDVGLSSVDDTADVDKPVSVATQTALDGKLDKVTGNSRVYTNDNNGDPGSTLLAQAPTTNSIAQRDANGNLRADNFLPSVTTTATSGGTTTLTVDSSQIQQFTGSQNQTVVLPTTNVPAGLSFMFVSTATGTITINASSGSNSTAIGQNNTVTLRAMQATPTAAAHWIVSGPTPITSATIDWWDSSPYTIVQRTGEGNINADAFVPSLSTTATSAGTTTLTVDSNEVQVFTGSQTQTVLLPTTGINAGHRFSIINQSGNTVTVQSSGANTVAGLPFANSGIFVALQASPTTAAHWVFLATPSSGFSNGPSFGTVAVRTGVGALYSNAFVPTATSTATVAGTTTLTSGSSEVQIFTGATTQTINLPTTGITAGQRYLIINTSSGLLTVNSSAGNIVATIQAASSSTVTALITSPTTAGHWATVSASSSVATSTGATSSTIAQRNASANLQADVFIPSLTSTATAAATTTLTVDSTEIQVFTGTSTQTVLMPTTGIITGHGLKLVNQSTSSLTINASGGSTLAIIEPKSTIVIHANTVSPTIPSHWSIVGGTAYVANLPEPGSLWSTGNAESFPRNGLGASTVVSQTATFSYFTAPTANTITKLAVATNGSGASSGITLARIGLYTVSAGTGNLTLVARTANDTTIGNTNDTLSQPALNAVGGYPASYTFVPGQRYALAVLQVGTTPSAFIGNVPFSSGIFSVGPQANGRVFSQSDLATSYTGATVGTFYWSPWIAGLQ